MFRSLVVVLENDRALPAVKPKGARLLLIGDVQRVSARSRILPATKRTSPITATHRITLRLFAMSGLLFSSRALGKERVGHTVLDAIEVGDGLNDVAPWFEAVAFDPIPMPRTVTPECWPGLQFDGTLGWRLPRL